jgi:hypothetical protein
MSNYVRSGCSYAGIYRTSSYAESNARASLFVAQLAVYAYVNLSDAQLARTLQGGMWVSGP